MRKQSLTNPHFNAIFCFSDSNFAFPGGDVCPPFLHNRTTLATIFEPFFVAPEHMYRFLITGTTEVYQQSLVFFTRDALTHEHTIHKDRTRDPFKLFQDSYKAVIALATRPHMSPLEIINHASGNLFESRTHKANEY